MAAASPSGHRKGLLEREASVAVMRAAGSGMGAVGTGAPGGGADLFWPYLTRAAEILTTFSKSDSVVKEGVAEEQCLEGTINIVVHHFIFYLLLSCDASVLLVRAR